MKRYELFSYRAEDNAEMREDSNGEWVMFSPLIAAAPELLEALQEVARTEMFLSDHPQRQSAYKAALAAIEKATGATP